MGQNAILAAARVSSWEKLVKNWRWAYLEASFPPATATRPKMLRHPARFTPRQRFHKRF
jgi:hypothetical protein